MLENEKILVVEDDSVDRLIFEKFAKRSEFQYPYKIVPSVAEAHAAINSEQFAAIVSDYNLGDGTALDILQRLRGTPLIVVTGLGDEKVAVRALKSGAYDYIVKEPSGGHLETIPLSIERAIANKKQQDELAKYKKYLEEMVQERTEKLNKEITRHKETLQVLEASQAQLKLAYTELQEKNILLKGVLSQIEKEKNVVYENIAQNIERNIFPMLKQLKIGANEHKLPTCMRTIELVEKYLLDINKDFFKSLEGLKIKLTPTEIKICHYIKAGHGIKEISELLSCSAETIKGHNKNIRKKIGISNSKVSLKAYLEKLSDL
ncbi:MAG: hypothetical protein A2504_13705 [Bdellovibrionales bacterium RIFOXYD12_FULL_39_22]|nr:MAG: hypothetical protein A2385_00430 [Bdellovibrionales bacterium RIFOXYB1_FULL_39_21]OFZ43857.1 MAG: hypothetical protein A2485_05100 [Bdellovibrionales bacterium RIFOXYC12_FULL_39_17]OFZ48809.1 MAG: hypothetical protein A2404_17745 [Bdellovibrionales bacterium RIFOXYC1_FULL_39_130]OFZ76542.1 MAG: hypothetical protein A2560_06410 [Bdellovibrionales bacterium RIFOXYD1_FULL_39_84]OFZ94776.1 MAG: hypothetical protein A2504_13705 [Bdellovibrionales bacterium RIFOXYD12_FULL_39_22]HLE12200.1 re